MVWRDSETAAGARGQGLSNHEAEAARLQPEDSSTFVHSSALLNGLSPSELAQLMAGAHARTYNRNETLFMQGHPIRQVVLLQSGCVKLTQLSSSGNEVILWLNGKGDAVGAQSLFSNCSHSCSAHVIEQCKALVWDSAKFERILAEMPCIRRNLIQIQMSQLNELEQRFREIATENVARRLAFAMVRLAKQVGKQSPQGIELSLTREELAQLTGTTLFTISRLLSKWTDLGIVTPRREAVLIRDLNGLKLLSVERD